MLDTHDLMLLQELEGNRFQPQSSPGHRFEVAEATLQRADWCCIVRNGCAPYPSYRPRPTLAESFGIATGDYARVR